MEIWIIALLLMILGILVVSPDSSEFKINHMDKKLDSIMKHLGIEEINIDKELKELLADEKRIPAAADTTVFALAEREGRTIASRGREDVLSWPSVLQRERVGKKIGQA